MIKYQDILGKEAYALAEGKQWGRVTDVLVDTKIFTVTGMAVKGTEDKFLALLSVKNIEESVIFQSVSDLQDPSSVEAGNIRGSKITGLKVIIENGNEAGTVVAFYFKRDTGEITHYEISKSVIKENLLMSQEGLVRMGDDAMIITEEAAEVAAEMKSKDNLRKTIAELGQKAGSFAAKAKLKIKGYSEDAGKGFEEVKKDAKAASEKYGPKLKEFGEKAEQGANAAGEKMKQAADKYGPKIKQGAQKAEAKFKEAADKYGPKIKEAGAKAKDAVKKAWNKISKKKDEQ